MTRRKSSKKKKFLPYKNLGELYTESVFGLPSVRRTTVLEEGPTLDIYAKDPETEETDKIGTVDKEYFNTKVKPAIRRGSSEAGKVRKEISDRLETANGLIGNNADIYENFVEVTGIELTKENTIAFRDGLLFTITDNQQFTLADLIHASYKGDKQAISDNLARVLKTFPVTAVFGRPGEGELALSFFAGGKKPIKGDVQIDNFLIELKGPDARLYKTEAIEDISVDSLVNIINAPENEKIDKICDFIIRYAGNNSLLGSFRSELSATVSSNLATYVQDVNFLYRVNKNKQTVIANNRLLIFKTMGWLHLLGYQKSFGFNGMLFFNKNSNNIPMRGLNAGSLSLSNLLTVNDIVITFRKDGGGFVVNYTGA
jgi:hypothetical protein